MRKRASFSKTTGEGSWPWNHWPTLIWAVQSLGLLMEIRISSGLNPKLALASLLPSLSLSLSLKLCSALGLGFRLCVEISLVYRVLHRGATRISALSDQWDKERLSLSLFPCTHSGFMNPSVFKKMFFRSVFVLSFLIIFACLWIQSDPSHLCLKS